MSKTLPTRDAASGWLRCLPVLLLLACGEGSGLPEPGQAPGALIGDLTVHIFNLGDRSEVLYTLRMPGGEQRELRFGSPPELASGATLRVFGADDGRAVAVSRFEVIGGTGDVEQSQRALIEGVKKPSKKWAFVMVDTGSGINVNKPVVMDRLFSDGPDSIRSYYREVSYGLQELSGDILGPFRFTPPEGGLCENFGAVVASVLPMIQGNYNQYLWYFGSRIANCPWLGVAQLGTAAGPTRHSFYNANAECVVLIQEPGHNFGMVHSSSLRCNRAGAPASMIASAEDGQCTHNEYGNPFDPMGGGGGTGSQQSFSRCLHMNGVQKAYQDWLGGCNIVRADTSGTFTIYPLEKACNGVQMLQVPLPAPRTLRFPASPGATLQSGIFTSYYVELRAPVGLDVALQTPRVFIVAAGDLREARLRGNPNWLIDTTPGTVSVNDAALAVGRTYVDPAPDGPQITVVSADATKAVIRVQLAGGAGSPESLGTGTCSDDRPFVAPGPQECLANLGDPLPSPPPDAGAPDTAPAVTPPPAYPSDAAAAPPANPGTAPTAPTNTASARGPVDGGCSLSGTASAPSAGSIVLLLLLALRFRSRRRGGSR